MKEKKTIGFDILDNVGIDKIDRIGTDMDMLDEKTKKRILEMTKKRFNDAIKGENTGIYNTDINKSEEVVENVEVYNRSKIRRIMTGVVNTAAVVGLAAGSVFLIKNLGRGDIDKPVEPDLPAVSSTEPANQTQEEKARNQRIEDYIQELYNQYVIVKPDEEQFYNSLEIKYAYLDINNDSVSELIIRYNLLALAPDSVFMQFNYFDGTKYIPFEEINDTSEMAKIDLQNRRLYEIYEGHEPGYYTYVKTWENVEFSDNKDFFTVQDTYCSSMVTYEPTEYTYTHNNLPCTKEEYESAWAEYENCNSAELNFIPYNVKKLNGQSAEETARNQRIEYEVQATFECYEKNIVDLSIDDLKIDYAYLDINNDSVDELFIRSKVLDVPESESTIICFFNGTEYIAFSHIVVDEFKFDLQNRKYYEILKENDDDTDYFTLRISTWENVELSADSDYFTSQDEYYSGIDPFIDGTGEQIYRRYNEPCTKEEYENAIAEYENCNSAELNFIPYTVKRESAEETEINLTFSNGKKPDGEVPITFDLPAEANGRFVIAFMVQKEDGTPEIQESSTFYCPEYCQLTQNVIGSGENVNVTAIITNLSNNKRATIGTYSFNFAQGRYTCLSGGDPYTAFESIGAFPET